MRITLLFALVLMLAACGKKGTYEDILTSKAWQYDENAIRNAVKGLPLSEMEMNVIDASMARMRGAKVEFRKNGEFAITTADNETRIGVWNLSPDGKNLFMATTNMQSDPNPVESIAEDRIVLGRMRERGMVFPKIFVPYVEGQQPPQPQPITIGVDTTAQDTSAGGN